MGEEEEDEEAEQREDGDQMDGPIRRRRGPRLHRLLVRRPRLLLGRRAHAGGPPGRGAQGEALHCGGGGGDFFLSLSSLYSLFLSVGAMRGVGRGDSRAACARAG